MIYSIIILNDRLEKRMKASSEKYITERGTRFTRKQKDLFLQEITQDMENLGYTSTRFHGKKGFVKVDNVLFGNLKHAKTVLYIPYDTPQKLLWPDPKYYPLNGNRSGMKEVFYVYGPALVVYMLLLAGTSFLPSLIEDARLRLGMTVFMYVMIGFLIFYLSRGFMNRNNVNRNTLSIIAALELAERFDKETRKKVCFLFADQNKNRYAGAALAAEELKKQNRTPGMICLNCIAAGENIAIGYPVNSKKLAQELNRFHKVKWKQMEMDDKKRFQTMMDHFPKAVMISSGTLDEKGDLCVKHTGTSKDTVYEEENLKQVVDLLEAYIKAL